MLEWEKNGQPPGKSRKPWFLQPKNRAPVPWLWQKRIRLIRLGFYSTGVMGLMEYYMEQYRTMTEMIMWNTNGQWIICSWGRDKRVTRQYEKWTIYRCFITHIYIYISIYWRCWFSIAIAKSNSQRVVGHCLHVSGSAVIYWTTTHRGLAKQAR